jgi:hypothetical protein
MKKCLVIVSALIACLAIGSVGVATAKKKHKPKQVATSISLTVSVTPATTYTPGSGTYSGAVSAGGPSGCRSGRPVTISRNGGAVAQATTQSNGTYSASVAAAPAAGQYTASVPQKVVKKKNKKKKTVTKFICSAATSSPATVP